MPPLVPRAPSRRSLRGDVGAPSCPDASAVRGASSRLRALRSLAFALGTSFAGTAWAGVGLEVEGGAERGATGEGDAAAPRGRKSKTGATPESPAREADAPRACAPAVARVGAPEAPRVLRLWIDPDPRDAAGQDPFLLGFPAWIAARELVAQRPDELALELHLARDPARRGVAQLRADEVRVLAARALSGGSPEEVLRTLSRVGTQSLRIALDRPDARTALARELGLGADALEVPAAERRCILDALDAADTTLESFMNLNGSAFPVIEVVERREGAAAAPRFLADAGRRANEIAGLLDEAEQDIPLPSWALQEFSSGIPSRGRLPELSRSYPQHGALVGGPGLPHHLLIFAEDELSSVLTGPLALALRQRERQPGRLSVQVLAVGNNPPGEQLTRRLCAARQLGLELPYLRYLASVDERRAERGVDLLETLDARGNTTACPSSEIPAMGDEESSGKAPPSLRRPRGIWFNGSSVSENELGRALADLPDPRSGAFQFFFDTRSSI